MVTQHPEHRMEQLLRWLDWNYKFINFNYRLLENTPNRLRFKFEGPVKWWSSFRRDLIDQTVHQNMQERYMPSDAMRDLYKMPTHSYTLPILIANWVTESRRIFKIDTDLQLLLDMTSLKGVKMRDVRFPLPTFAVALEKPIIGDRGLLYDFVIASQVSLDNTPGIYLQFCDQRLENPPPQFTAMDVEILEKHIAKGRIDQGARKLESIMGTKVITMPIGIGHFVPTNDPDMDVLDACKVNQYDCFERLSAQDKAAGFELTFESMTRIVLGMCLYLRSTISKSSKPVEWKPIDNKLEQPDRRKPPITDEATICLVESRFKLSAKERETFSDPENKPSRNTGEIGPHARTGFWHRPKGQGHDSFAEKTEWTRPTIVREDLYIPGTPLRGAEKLLGFSKK